MARRVSEVQAYAPWLVFDVDGVVAGYAYASKHRAREAYQWAIEASVYIASRFQRQGIARSLYSHLFQELKQRGYHVVLAGVTLPNPSSVGFHEAMGFKQIGTYRAIGYKLGSWHDVMWLDLRLQPIEVSPVTVG